MESQRVQTIKTRRWVERPLGNSVVLPWSSHSLYPTIHRARPLRAQMQRATDGKNFQRSCDLSEGCRKTASLTGGGSEYKALASSCLPPCLPLLPGQPNSSTQKSKKPSDAILYWSTIWGKAG